MIRGAPRYLTGAAAGAAGVLALIPEAQVGADGRTVRPTGLIVLAPGAVRRYPIPAGPRLTLRGRLGGAPTRTRAALPAPAETASADVAESWIVPGAARPGEDPRLAAVFGPTQPAPHSICISLWQAGCPPGASGLRRVRLGHVEIVGGVVVIRLEGSRRGGAWRRALLLAGVGAGIGWLLRRARRAGGQAVRPKT